MACSYGHGRSSRRSTPRSRPPGCSCSAADPDRNQRFPALYAVARAPRSRAKKDAPAPADSGDK